MVVTSFSALAGERIDETKELSSNGRFSMENKSGFVKITTWDKQEVRVVGELDERAKGYTFESDGKRAYFEVEVPSQMWSNRNSDGSRLEVFVPVNVKFEYEGVNSEVDVRGIRGRTEIGTVNGDITARDLEGDTRLSTVNGKISADSLKGDITLASVNGEIKDKNSSARRAEMEVVNGEINIQSDYQELSVSSVNGDIELVMQTVNELRMETVNGRIDAELALAEKGQINITTVGGRVDLKFKNDVEARFEIEAHAGGRIVNNLTKDEVKKAKYGPARSLYFKTGNAKADVEIETVNGRIELDKK